MMKAHHGCSQVIFDHNLKHRKTLGSSLPSTPRNSSVSGAGPGSRLTTPRDTSNSEQGMFGLPQVHQDTGNECCVQSVIITSSTYQLTTLHHIFSSYSFIFSSPVKQLILLTLIKLESVPETNQY